MSKKYTLEDFLRDPEFVRWARNPDKESSEFWNSFANTHPESKADLLKARELLSALRLSHDDVPPDARQEVLENIVRKINENALNKQAQSQQNWWSTLLRVAAVFTITLGGLYAFYQINKTGNQEDAVQPPMLVKEAPFGRKLQTQLPDGTVAWLNAGSRLTYTESKSPVSRMVTLSGEAFFDVAKDAAKPFIVNAGSLSVKAIGTSFNVRAYDTDTLAEVALITGKVAVENLSRKYQGIELIPGEKAVLQENKITLDKLPFDYLYEVGWKEGILVFDHADFEEVQKKLERWYGVRIHPQDHELTQGWDMSGRYHDQSLEMVLRHLAYTKNFDFTIKGEDVYIMQ